MYVVQFQLDEEPNLVQHHAICFSYARSHGSTGLAYIRDYEIPFFPAAIHNSNPLYPPLLKGHAKDVYTRRKIRVNFNNGRGPRLIIRMWFIKTKATSVYTTHYALCKPQQPLYRMSHVYRWVHNMSTWLYTSTLVHDKNICEKHLHLTLYITDID